MALLLLRGGLVLFRRVGEGDRVAFVEAGQHHLALAALHQRDVARA